MHTRILHRRYSTASFLTLVITRCGTGAVPDFILPQARKIFGDYHEQQFVKKGVAAFKLDECDAANYANADREWSFPDIAKFPSGVDGIQMRQLFGLLYQKTMLNLYRKNNMRPCLMFVQIISLLRLTPPHFIPTCMSCVILCA
jgi:hypothetical protein